MEMLSFKNSNNFSYIEAILSCHHQCLHNMQTEDKRRVKHFLQVTPKTSAVPKISLLMEEYKVVLMFVYIF